MIWYAPYNNRLAYYLATTASTWLGSSVKSYKVKTTFLFTFCYFQFRENFQRDTAGGTEEVIVKGWDVHDLPRDKKNLTGGCERQDIHTR